MTAIEKAGIASFLDLAGDYLSGGFRRPHGEYTFEDDAADAAALAATETAAEQKARALTENGIQGDLTDTRSSHSNALKVNSTDDDGSRSDSTETLDSQSNSLKVNSADDDGSRSGAVRDGLEALAAEIAACTRCGLCSTRTHTVPGEGPPAPLVMVVGEGPGADEDAQGRPFVGRAGQLLDRMLDSRGKIGLFRTVNCYIANIVKCRPPGNRNPQPDEITACVPFLVRQIKLLRPRIILAAGNTAAKTLLDSTEGITRLRGIFTTFRGTLLMDGEFNIPLLPTFHPSALLRDESLKAPVWEDLKTLRARLCELDGDYAARMAAIPL